MGFGVTDERCNVVIGEEGVGEDLGRWEAGVRMSVSRVSCSMDKLVDKAYGRLSMP